MTYQIIGICGVHIAESFLTGLVLTFHCARVWVVILCQAFVS